MIKIKYTKIAILLACLILITSNISAFAVSSAYWKENPLKMYAGETKEITLVLQNMPGPTDIKAKGTVIEGSEIAELIGSNEYLVLLGSKTNVGVKISVPKEAQIGDEYKVIFSFTTIPTEDAETMGFRGSVEKEIPITIIEKIEKAPTTGAAILGEGDLSWTSYLAIGVLLIVTITFFLLARKRAKEEKKKVRQI